MSPLKTAAVIGSGISGPMAAASLARDGYSVDVFEARPADQLHSGGILGITHEAWKLFEAARPERLELDNGGDIYRYITWTDLHLVLTEWAESLGVRFHYSHPVEKNPLDIDHYDAVVWSTGVGAAREVTHGEYSGLVVARGLAYQFSGTSWASERGVDEKTGAWYFAAGDTRDGASLTMFLHRSDVLLRTTYSPERPPEATQLPPRWARLTESVKLWQFAPLSDWEVPATMVNHAFGHSEVRIGDANGQLRPQTSMGANRGIMEAAAVPKLVQINHDARFAEESLLGARRHEYERGIKLAVERDGLG